MRWKLDLLLWPRDQETEIPVEACLLSQTREPRQSKSSSNFWWPLFWQHWHDLHALGSTGQTVNKEYNIEVLREFMKRFRRKRPATVETASGISTWTMHQSTFQSLSLTIWPRWASKTVPHLPIVQTLLPGTFGCYLSSEAVVMRQLRRWKRLWRRSLTRSHKMSSMGPSRNFLERYKKCIAAGGDYFEGTRVLCVYYQ